ncbi:uncharacterized protein LOC131940887 [Physella acuta]|uniref:uncharacterized protein LOC131940887 n=1 Tax=Physella acuta TaxID=109671 RepID=UPI0027DDCD49|nr:uncharacterized protein LOC131940887 [Physella acuta]
MWVFLNLVINFNCILLEVLYAVFVVMDIEKKSRRNQHVSSRSKNCINHTKKTLDNTTECTQPKAQKSRKSRSKRKTSQPTCEKKKKIKLKYFNKHGSSPESPTNSGHKQETLNQMKRVDKYKQTQERANLTNQHIKSPSLPLLCLDGMKRKRIFENINIFLGEQIRIYTRSYAPHNRYVYIVMIKVGDLSRAIEDHLKKLHFIPDRSYLWMIPNVMLRVDLNAQCTKYNIQIVDGKDLKQTLTSLVYCRSQDCSLDLHLLTVERAMEVFHFFYQQKKKGMRIR